MKDPMDDAPLDPVDQLLRQAAHAETDVEAIACGERQRRRPGPGALQRRPRPQVPQRVAASLHHNRIASDLAPEHQAAHGNLGIAATALRDWPVAREAWRRAGLEIDEGEGPIDMDLGMTPVRLNPDGDAEVVWGRRIDPAREVLTRWSARGNGFLSRLTRKANAKRLLRFECALAGSQVH